MADQGCGSMSIVPKEKGIVGPFISQDRLNFCEANVLSRRQNYFNH